MASWEKIKFFWKTMLGSTGSTLAATSTASGYSVANIYNMLEINKWKSDSTASPQYITLDLGSGNTATADYLAILGHNLYSIDAVVSLQYSTDNFSSDINEPFTGFVPAADAVVLKEFTAPDAKRYWRLKLQKDGGGSFSAAPEIAICIWGEKTELAYASSSFDPHEEEIHANVVRGDTGYVLGVHEKWREQRMSLTFSDAKADLYAKVKEWWNTNGLRQFFVAWERGNSPDEVFLMMSDPKRNHPLRRGGACRDITISLTGRREDA